MSADTREDMSGVEIAEFMNSQETGVLAMANGDDGYGIPVSFDYDDDTGRVYLRLGYAPGSQKRSFLESSELVSFVVYDRTDEGWKSVVVEGYVETLADTNLDSSIEEAVMDLDVPYFRVHERPASDLEINVLCIAPATVTGVVEARS